MQWHKKTLASFLHSFLYYCYCRCVVNSGTILERCWNKSFVTLRMRRQFWNVSASRWNEPFVLEQALRRIITFEFFVAGQPLRLPRKPQSAEGKASFGRLANPQRRCRYNVAIIVASRYYRALSRLPKKRRHVLPTTLRASTCT